MEKNAGIANTKIRPILSTFNNTSGIPRLNWAGVNAVGRMLIKLRLKSRGGKVSQIPFLMMSVIVIFKDHFSTFRSETLRSNVKAVTINIVFISIL